MRYIRYIFTMFLSALCVSCVVPFDMKLDDEPIICLNAFPGVEDVVVFSIEPAYSLSNSAVHPDFSPIIRFTVNGDEIPVVQNTGFCISSDYPEERYIADYRPSPGDEMTIEVSSEGFETVHAHTTIPQPFPERRIDYRTVEVGDREYNVVSVTFKDNEKTSDAYGLQIFNEIIREFIDTTEIYRHYYAGEQIADDYDMAPETLEGMPIHFEGTVMGGWSLAGWDDSDFNGKEKTLEAVVNTHSWYGTSAYESFFEQEYIHWEYDPERDCQIMADALEHNKLYLYTMSEEFYRYAVAQELIDENAGMFAGIAPSNFCYSNVENGYGAFAGVWRVETDWITPEFIEQNR